MNVGVCASDDEGCSVLKLVSLKAQSRKPHCKPVSFTGRWNSICETHTGTVVRVCFTERDA